MVNTGNVSIVQTTATTDNKVDTMSGKRSRVKSSGFYHDDTIDSKRTRQKGERTQTHDHVKLKNLAKKYPGFKDLNKAMNKISVKIAGEATLGDLEFSLGELGHKPRPWNNSKDFGAINAHKIVQPMKPNSKEINTLAQTIINRVLERKPELTDLGTG